MQMSSTHSLMLAAAFLVLVPFALADDDMEVYVDLGLNDVGDQRTEPEGTERPLNAGIGDPVLKLNRHTFDGNVLAGDKYVKKWLVLFCYPWFEPCAEADVLFRTLARDIQPKRNAGLMSSDIRFAQVDCSTDRVLCNRMGVHNYPYVGRYSDGQKDTWLGRFFNSEDDTRFLSFIEGEGMAAPCAVGDVVDGNWKGKGRYYGAAIATVNSDNTVTVNWHDEDTSGRTLAADQVRKNGIACSIAARMAQQDRQPTVWQELRRKGRELGNHQNGDAFLFAVATIGLVAYVCYMRISAKSDFVKTSSAHVEIDVDSLNVACREPPATMMPSAGRRSIVL